MFESLQTRLQQKADSLVALLHKKSQERLTIMVIPHSQEQIFSFHLNLLMILFLTGTLSLVIVMAGYAYYHRQVKEREVAHLKTLYGVNYTQANNLNEQTEQTRILHAKLNENLSEIATEIGIKSNEMEILYNYRDLEKQAEDILYDEIVKRHDVAPGTNYLPSVYNIKANYFLLKDHYGLLNALRDSIYNGLGVYSSIPMGRPFSSFSYLRDSSPFGLRLDPVSRGHLEFHTGMDTSGPEGTPVYASGPGVVVRTTYGDVGYGHSVTIRHEYGFSSLYAHFSRVRVRTGQIVSRGQLIGNIGHTGRVTGDHLHYEVKLDGKQIDPKPYVCATDLNTPTCRSFNSNDED